MTALQELIERIKAYQEGILALSNENEKLEVSANAILTSTGLILMQAQVFLEKEKQQIIESYEQGILDEIDSSTFKNGEEFYKAIYG